MLGQCWDCWVRQTPGWERQPAKRRCCCCVVLGYSCMQGSASLCSTMKGPLGRHSSPSCKLLSVSCSLSPFPKASFGSLANEDHTRRWKWSARSVPLPLQQDLLCKKPIIQNESGPSCHLPGAQSSCWGWSWLARGCNTTLFLHPAWSSLKVTPGFCQ